MLPISTRQVADFLWEGKLTKNNHCKCSIGGQSFSIVWFFLKNVISWGFFLVGRKKIE